MSDRFLIRHPETGAEYGLSSIDIFRDRWEPLGFIVPDEQPNGWTAPDVSRKAKRTKASEADAPKDED